MKQTILTMCMLIIATCYLSAQDFSSSSSMLSNDECYTMPFAAGDISGGTISESSPFTLSSGPNRVDDDDEETGRGEDIDDPDRPTDPAETPIGDLPIVLLLLLAAGYGVYAVRRRKQRAQ